MKNQLCYELRLMRINVELTSRGFQWQSMEGRVQHDAHELNRLLVDALEKSLKKTSAETLCSKLYEGTCINQILCLNCKSLSSRHEKYYDLNLQVLSCANALQALHQYCKEELLHDDSAYHCSVCHSKQQAYRTSKIDELPPMLTFSCNRFRIDKSTHWNRVKLTTECEYPLFMNDLQVALNQYDLSNYSKESSSPSTLHNNIRYHEQQKALQQTMVWIGDLYDAVKCLPPF